LRGTLRYRGFCSNAMALVKLGLISLTDHPSLHQQGPDITWRQFMCDLLHVNRDMYYENVKAVILEKLDYNGNQMHAIEELGLLSEELVTKLGNPLDSLAIFMAKRLAYGYFLFF
jgi:alpha-aminoadipic semialdehyde synthase